VVWAKGASPEPSGTAADGGVGPDADENDATSISPFRARFLALRNQWALRDVEAIDHGSALSFPTTADDGGGDAPSVADDGRDEASGKRSDMEDAANDVADGLETEMVAT